MYELIDLETANLVGTYDTEAEALQVVRVAVVRYGRDSVATLALGVVADDEDRVIAAGSALVALAQSSASGAEPRSA